MKVNFCPIPVLVNTLQNVLWSMVRVVQKESKHLSSTLNCKNNVGGKKYLMTCMQHLTGWVDLLTVQIKLLLAKTIFQ